MQANELVIIVVFKSTIDDLEVERCIVDVDAVGGEVGELVVPDDVGGVPRGAVGVVARAKIIHGGVAADDDGPVG